MSKECEDMGHTFGSESLAITAGPASEFIDVGLTLFSVLESKGFWKNFSFVEWEGGCNLT